MSLYKEAVEKIPKFSKTHDTESDTVVVNQEHQYLAKPKLLINWRIVKVERECNRLLRDIP